MSKYNVFDATGAFVGVVDADNDQQALEQAKIEMPEKNPTKVEDRGSGSGASDR